MYKERKITLPKGQEGFNLHVLSDIYINAEAGRKVYLKKLKQDIELIKNDPLAKVVLNGNFFYFDPYIFGFDNTRTMLENVKMDYLTRKRVTTELEPISKTENSEEKFDLFGKLSPEAQIMYTRQLLQQSVAGELHSLTPYTDATMKILQTKVYEPYIKEYVKLLEPIKDKIIAINSGNEEAKVNNFRQYDPLQQLAEALGIANLHTDERFTVLWIKQNNRLTDYKDKEISMIISYGILKANSHGAVESKMRNMYKNFLSFDFYVTSGYQKFGNFKENRFWRDKNNNLLFKPAYFLYYAGYDKVGEVNKVRLASYNAENEVNNHYVNISVSRNPVYINKKIVNESGEMIEFDENNLDLFVEETTVPKSKQKHISQVAFKMPYKAYINTMEYNVPSKMQEILDGINSLREIEKQALLDAIDAKINNAPNLLNNALINRKMTEESLIEETELEFSKK